jgi:hypothetical protein
MIKSDENQIDKRVFEKISDVSNSGVRKSVTLNLNGK